MSWINECDAAHYISSSLSHTHNQSHIHTHVWTVSLAQELMINGASTSQRQDDRVHLAPEDKSDRWSSILPPLPHKGAIMLSRDVVHPPRCFAWRIRAPLLTQWSSCRKVGGVVERRGKRLISLNSLCQTTASGFWQIKDAALKSPQAEFSPYLCYCFAWAEQWREKL